MPIEKVPVVHKFGIISQSQRVDLEERIARKALIESQRLTSQRPPPKPLSFEVTEEFVFKFNDSSEEDKEKLEDAAMKMLQRLRRLAGLREAGEASHSDLGRAWVDLALLAQCRSSKLEEACLETLLASLDQAYILEENILSLFYLAKSGIHWLKRDSLHQTVIRSGEIKLLKMTFLVFVRLYCHHMLGQLKSYEDQQISLAQYLKGFSEKSNWYSQFPGGYRSVQFIVESGSVICSLFQSTDNDFTFGTGTNTVGDSLKDDQLDASSVHKGGHATAEYFIRSAADGSSTGTFLWHTLNVWYAANYEKSRLSNALYGLFQNTSYLSQESWLNLLVAFHVLSDASRNNLDVLVAFQYLIACKLAPVQTPVVDPGLSICQNCYSTFPSNRDETSCVDNVQLCEDSSSKIISPEDQHASQSSSNILEKLQNFVELERTTTSENGTETSSPNQEQFMKKPVTETSLKNETKERIETGKDLCEEPTYRMMSQLTLQRPNYRWPWILLYTFCECMTNICLHGNSSTIRKVALLGEDDDRQCHNTRKVKRTYGLVDFLQYGKENDFNGFRVRYGAVQGLVQIHCHCHGDSTKEGLTNVAWSYLMDCQSIEKDQRVLDAIKVGKVEADFQNKLATEHIPLSLLSSRLATTLSQLSHSQQPALTQAKAPSSPPKDRSTKRSAAKIVTISTKVAATKPSIRQEINLCNARQKPRQDYRTRANLDLRNVIEDQWKKQLHEEREKELETNVNELNTKRTEEINTEHVT